MERAIAIVVAFLLAVMGLAFLLAQPHSSGRLLIGLLLWLSAGAVLFLAYRRRQTVVIQQKLEIGGRIGAQMLKCANCGAELAKEHIQVRDGAVFAECPYCHTPFQLQEEPKW